MRILWSKSLALFFVPFILKGRSIASPAFVSATLWLGNMAALLRVGSLLLAPLLVSLNVAGASLYAIVFGLSGPLGLALAVCLTVNLWPALCPPTHAMP